MPDFDRCRTDPGVRSFQPRQDSNPRKDATHKTVLHRLHLLSHETALNRTVESADKHFILYLLSDSPIYQ